MPDKIIAFTKLQSPYCHFRVKVAKSFFSRFKGLMGQKNLAKDQALVITKCNSIHTFFMKFDIDAVFVDEEYKVVEIIENIGRSIVISPVKEAVDVIEFNSGVVKNCKIEIGDNVKFIYT